MILVAISMIAIIAMAALSIDVITLYLAKLEAQRSADAAALAAAKIIALSGITGDPSNGTSNWGAICGGSTSAATVTALAVAQQNSIGTIAVPTASVTVTYSAGSGGAITQNTDCTTLGGGLTAFGVNPMVTVQLTRANLPNFFSRIWGNAGTNISASATAEAFNPSDSGNSGNQTTGTLTPVQPRCVKPWIVPNLDPLNPGSTCTTNCTPFVDTSSGSIKHQGISLSGGPAPNTGVIGETFWLMPDCRHSNPNGCSFRGGGPGVQPQANYPKGSDIFLESTPNLFYVPGQVGTTTVMAIPSCTSGDPYEEAIEGCDQPTNYSCGVPNANVADLTRNPAGTTSAGVQCLTHQGDLTNLTESSGQDYFNSFAAPSTYPFQIYAGSSNPLVASASLAAGSQITVSPSIVSLPIYDNTTNLTEGVANNVTFVGFLQVFINAADTNGNVNVTVLNVAGCSNGSSNPVGNPVISNSPVPVRLITPP